MSSAWLKQLAKANILRPQASYVRVIASCRGRVEAEVDIMGRPMDPLK